MPTSNTISLSSIDRSPGEVNPALDPGIYVPPPLPVRPSAFAPGNVLPDVGNVDVVSGTIVTDGGNTIIPSQPVYISVSENGNLVLVRATNLNFTGAVNVTTDDSSAVINVLSGNWAFTGNTMYNINGGAIDNGDLSHGATSFVSIPGNGSGNAMSLLNYYGNIVLTPSLTPSSTYSWTFDRTGNLVMPSNTASINYANGQPYGGPGGGSTYGNSNVAAFLSSFGSNSISTTGTISGNIQAPDGNGSVLINASGAIGAAAGFSYDSDADMLFVPAATFQGANITGVNALYAGIGGYAILGSSVIAQLTSNVDSYSQVNQQNINTGSLASGDYIITADNGTDDTYYLDIGLAGSNHADPDFFGDTGSNNDGYFYVTAADQAGPSSASGPGNLILGSTNGVIKMFVGNTAQANVITTVNSAGLSVAGNITLSQNGWLNFNSGGGIQQVLNEDFYIRGSDDEEDGWSILNVIDDGAGNDLTKTQLQYNRFSVYTDIQGNNYSFDFREGGEFDVPKSIRGPVGGNLVISIGDQPSSNTFIDLQTRSYVGDALISNIRIANPNVTVSTSSGAHTWTFDGTGQMTLAGTPAIVKTIDDGYAFSGFISGISLTNPVVVDLTDNVFGGPESGKVTIFNVNGTTEANGTWYFLAVESNQFALYYDADQDQPVDGTGWTAWTSGGQALAYGQHDMTLIGGNIMLTADQNGIARDFLFGNTGNLTLPISGKIVGATANNNGYLNWLGNSSGDGGGYTTLRLVPDDTRESADQYLIIDPTAPGHIHIRAGGTQDNSSADLFLGGENSYFKVNAGANNEVRISANSHAWVFGADSVLTVPGEGVIRSIQDTVILQSYDSFGNTYSARLGTTGGLYFETSDYPAGWLNLTNSSGDANISSPGGSINIDSANGTSGAAGKDINITAGDADQTDYYTTAGGDVNIQGGMGAFNDGGGGGPGGNVNLIAGTSADPAGHTGNINITSGTNNWVFAYNSGLVFPAVAYANLTAIAGARAFISDGNLVATGNFGAQVSGGGSNTVPVWSNGTNWYIG